MIAANFFVLALPDLLGSTAIAFAIGTLVLVLLNTAILATWRSGDHVTASEIVPGTVRGTVLRSAGAVAVGLVAAALVLVAARAWLQRILIFPIDAQRADMLVVIEQGIRRALQGQNPYATYHVPWEVTLPYGPMLWAPYIVPYLVRADIRCAAIASALFIPTVCAVCATALAFDRRIAAAAGFVVMLSAMVFSPDLRGFLSIAHTPSYWPLLAMFAWFVADRADVLLPRRSRSDARIDIVCQPNLPDAAAVRDMSVSLNGTVLGTITLHPGWQTVTLDAPARAWLYGVNRLGLSFSGGESPPESGGRSDSRDLSVAFARFAVRTP